MHNRPREGDESNRTIDRESGMANTSGRHFLQLPGPTNVPDRVLRAIDKPTMDHRGPAFGEMARALLEDLKKIFQNRESSDHLPGVRDRRLGGGIGEYAVAG